MLPASLRGPFSFVCDVAILRRGVEAGAGLGRGPRHVAVAAHDGLREDGVKLAEQAPQGSALGQRARVGRTALGVQPALVADADAATVEGAAVGAHLQQLPVLRHRAVRADVEVVTDGAEAALPVVAQQLPGRIGHRRARGRAVDDEVAHTLSGVHHRAVFHAGEEGGLAGHPFPADAQGKLILRHASAAAYHRPTHDDTPRAVRAATNACTTAWRILIQLSLFDSFMMIGI